MSIRFDGRVAIVTGAGRGLGRSHALTLASRGAKVVVNDPGLSRDNRHAADEVVEEVRAAGGEAVASHESVADAAAAARVVAQAMNTFGRLDILVNNAGVLRDKTFAKMEMADWDLVLQVHLSGSAYCTRAAWPEMQRNRYGRVVFTTSNAGLYGSFGQSNYAAAKAGLIGLMNTLQQEGAKYGILVNTVAPIAATPMTQGVLASDVAPYFRPEHASAAVALLCSEVFTHSGVILSAAAGHYAVVRLQCSPGMQFDPLGITPPELLWERWQGIANANGSRGFPNAGAETDSILQAIAQRDPAARDLG